MYTMQQKQICNFVWKRVINLLPTRSSLIKQNNLQIHQHLKISHQAGVLVAVILIEAIVRKLILLNQAIAKARAVLPEKQKIKTQGGQTAYEYRAGNWNTALLTDMGFEFGRNKQRLLNVSVNYFTGIGNMNKQTVSSVSGTKTNFATLESNASGWNMRIGIPLHLQKKNPESIQIQTKLKGQAVTIK